MTPLTPTTSTESGEAYPLPPPPPMFIAVHPDATILDTSITSTSITSPSDVAVRMEQPILNEHLMDSILAQELQQLSLKDREAINDEIHGVANLAVQETPQFVSEKLTEMEETLLLRHVQPNDDDVIGLHYDGGVLGGINHNNFTSTTSNDAAYNEALMLGSQYIHDKAIHLMFLRAELFDATRAAVRFVNFLQLLRDYLGPEALVHEPWKLCNFNAEELKFFKQGVFQVFGRDQVGRLVHAMMDDIGNNSTLATRLKVQIYVFMAMEEDVETQQKGIVAMFYQSNQSNQSTVLTNGEVRRMLNRSIKVAPVRISASHVCLPNTPVSSLLKALVLATATPSIRARCRFHIGSPIEILYSLQTFGISPDQMPINSNTGTIKTQNHLKWLHMRQAMEEARATGGPNYVFRGISFPNHQDVLLGRGRPNLIHRGNVAMRHAVKLRLPRFAASTSKEEKAAIIQEVVHATYLSGGRFLMEDPGKNGWWVEADLDAAKKKVGSHFRDKKLSCKAQPTLAALAEPPSLSIPSSLWPTLMPESGPTNNRKEATKSSRRQDLDSSTYEFLQGSAHEHKRYKGSHCCEMWDNMCSL